MEDARNGSGRIKHSRPRWLYWLVGAAILIGLTVLAIHLAGGGMGVHFQ